MASFDRRTQKLILTGDELLKIARHCLKEVELSDPEIFYYEVELRCDLEAREVGFRTRCQNQVGNTAEREVSFEIDLIIPDDSD
jgi:hypothetical protein